MRMIAPLTLAAILVLSNLTWMANSQAAPATGFTVFAPPGNSKGVVLYLADPRPDPALLDQLQNLTYTVAVVEPKVAAPAFPDRANCQTRDTDYGNLLGTLKARDPSLPDRAPILLGSGRGASQVVLALAGASSGQFHAGISLDFCPPVAPAGCPDPAVPTHLPVNWYVFQAAPACDAGAAARYIGRIDNAKRVDLAASAGRPPVPAELTALLQWLDPRIPDQAAATGEVAGVPLTEVRATGHSTDLLAILLSGDGGWAAIDRGLAAELAARGIDTVGWDSLSYFWSAKTPERTAHDLERVIAHYSRAWNKSRIMLVGYSFGADVLPFVITRLAPEARQRVRLAAFLGLGQNGAFEFHLSDWLGSGSDGQWPTGPEIRRLADIRRLCIYGADETDSGCSGLEDAGVKVVKLGGDHHFDEAYRLLADQLMQALP